MSWIEPKDRYLLKWPGPLIHEVLPDGGWVMYALRANGARVIVDVVFSSLPSGVTRKHLRAIKPEDAIKRFYKDISMHVQLREWVSVMRDGGQPEQNWRPFLDLVEATQEQWEQWNQVLERWRSRPLDGRSNLRRIALVAALYVQALNRGSIRPNEEAAAEMERSLSQIREDLRAARRKGLLEPMQPGRGQAIGHLTNEARKILDGEE